MKKTFRKLFSWTLTLTLLITNTAVFAEDTVSRGNTENLLWNADYVEYGTESIYEDFPVLIDKILNGDMNLDLDFTYLKNLGENDSATLTITNNSTHENILVKNFSESIYADIEGIAEDNSYLISISENIGGDHSIYEKILVVDKQEVQFPINATIGNKIISNNVGENFNCLMIKKVGDNGQCNHDENEECTSACSPIKKIVPENLGSFYNELDLNTYYEVQLEASYNNVSTRYRGFISTYSDESDLGIFTLDYTLLDLPNASAVAIGSEDDMISTASIFDNAYEYKEYSTMVAYSSTNQMVMLTAPETGWYTIETVGNVDMEIRLYNSLSSTDYYTYTDGGTGGNVSFRMALAAGVSQYMQIRRESGSNGYYGFKIRYEDGERADDLCNYFDELQAQAEAGNYSDYDYTNLYIDYAGDVDMAVYNTTAGSGYIEVINYGRAIDFGIYYNGDSSDEFDDLWLIEEDFCRDVINAGTIDDETWISTDSFYKGRTYIKINKSSKTDLVGGRYELHVYTPNRMDDAEAEINAVDGATPVTPINVSLSEGYHASGSNLLHTIHKSDEDWFKLDMTNETEKIDLTAILSKGNGTNLYDIQLYRNVEILSTDPQSWKLSRTFGTVETTDDQKTLTYKMQPGYTYYLCVSGSSSVYDSRYKYGIDITCGSIDTTPSATLSENIVLTHTQGTNITSLDSFLNSVMENLICMEGSVEIDSSVAISDVILYYNGTELTADIVNGFSAGSYSIVAKYKDAEATGGNIILVVSAPAVQQIAELAGTLNKSITATTKRDWFYCARSFANYKRVADGDTASTLGISTTVNALKAYDTTLSLTVSQRADIETTANAACYIYTNGETCAAIDNGFLYGADVDNLTMDFVYSRIEANTPVILKLHDEETPNDINLARYILVYGVNKTTNMLKVYDPIDASVEWVTWASIFDGGYSSDNPDLKYSGSIIFDPDF